MGRAPCCDKANVKRGPWSPEEDTTLRNYVQRHGTGGNWIALPQKAGLKRCGKSCRLRWLNYLRPDIKHGGFTEEEDNIICNLYQSMGSRWSVIASHLPGRTDNDVKNYWNTKLKKKLMVSKTNLPAIVNTSAKRNHIQFSSPQLPQVIKTESYASTSVSESSTSLSSIEFGFGYDAEFHRWLTDPNSFSPPVLKESSDFGAGATRYGASSSSVPMNNGLNPFSAIGGGEVDGFFMDLSYVPSYGLFNGYGLQEKMGEAAPGLANFPYTNMVANSDTNSQGFYQRC